MRSLILVLLLSAFISGCSDSTPPEISHEITFGKHEASLYEEITTYADLSLNEKTLTMKSKVGASCWLLNNGPYVTKDGGEISVADEHGGLLLKLRIHPSGDLIFSYQMNHHFGGKSNLDTGTVVIPKSYVDAR